MESISRHPQIRFFREHLPEGVSFQIAARMLGAFDHTILRGWLKRGVFPQDAFAQTANLLNLSARQLNKAGIRQGNWSTEQNPVRRNLLPLLRNIVDSNLESMAYEELDLIIRKQGRLMSLMLPAEIRALLGQRLGK